MEQDREQSLEERFAETRKIYGTLGPQMRLELMAKVFGGLMAEASIDFNSHRNLELTIMTSMTWAVKAVASAGLWSDELTDLAEVLKTTCETLRKAGSH